MSGVDRMEVVGDQVLLLPVPRRYYLTVVRALADAMAAGEPRADHLQAQVQAESSSGDKDPSRPWSRDEVQQLKRMYLNPSTRVILDLGSDRPGEWVSIRDVEKRANRTFHQTRADLGGFSKTTKRMFGHATHQTKWPFEAGWAVDGKQQYSYRVSEDVARWWREV